MDEIHPLDKPGIRAEIMAILGVSPQVISNWKFRGTPVEYCYELEQKTLGRITRKELRPADCWRIWPDLAHLDPEASVTTEQAVTENVTPTKPQPEPLPFSAARAVAAKCSKGGSDVKPTNPIPWRTRAQTKTKVDSFFVEFSVLASASVIRDRILRSAGYRPENLKPSQVMLILKLTRARGFHEGIAYILEDLSYAPTTPIKPADVAEDLMRQVIESQRLLALQMERLASLQPQLRAAA